MNEIHEFFQGILGLGADPKSITIPQMIARAVSIYLIGWLMLRVGEHRFLGKNTAFDIVLGFIFGSLLSRAINGAAPFSETIVAGLTLLTLHWAFLVIAFHSDRLDRLINGEVRQIIRDGEINKRQMRKARLSPRVLRENLRLNGGVSDPSQVQEADFEPSGSVSVVPAKQDRDLRIVDVQVRDGVQTLRIEIS